MTGLKTVYKNSNFSSALNSLNNISIQSILDVFVVQGLISQKDVDELKSRYKTNREVQNVLLKNKIVNKDTINKAYSILLKFPYVSLSGLKIPKQALEAIPKPIAQKYKVIPFGLKGNTIQLAIADPAELSINFSAGIEKIAKDKGLSLDLYITGDSDFKSAIIQYDGKVAGDKLETSSYPVIFLKNVNIPAKFLGKLPLDFIKQFNIVIFHQKENGTYCVAAENPDDAVTAKALRDLKESNGVDFQIFATSKSDIDYVIDHYQSKLDPEQIKDEDSVRRFEEPVDGSAEDDMQDDKKVSQVGVRSEREDEVIDIKSMFSSFLGGGKEKKAQILTIDSLDNEEEHKEEKTAEKSARKIQINEESSSDERPEAKEDDSSANQNTIGKTQRDDGEGENIGDLLDHELESEEELRSLVEKASIPKIVAGTISLALNMKASDIHIEAGQKDLRVRFRIDGLLRDIVRLPLEKHPPIISRIKILARLKLDETRIPQDGRFSVSLKNREVDVRTSSLPTVFGEKIVMRILDKEQAILSLEDLGMAGRAFELTTRAIDEPYGIILSTGPTGSGKSTTLYAIINRISVPSVNIVTLEDPVEYEIPGVNQCQVRPGIGFTFAEGLRSVLRQDPNVLMVGEIRDGETANMSTHAALTGHLVLSTLHTNDASGALPRLINMGIEPFLITSSVKLIIGQRLVRRICVHCKEEMKLPEALISEVRRELEKIPESNRSDRKRIPKELRFYHGVGCSKCNHGYRGRVGIFEVLRMTDEIEELAVAKRSSGEIKNAALTDGMITMKQDGILKALSGVTTINEVFRATSSS